MYGRGADKNDATAASTFESLKAKYHAALVEADEQHVRWQSLQVQDGKLYAKGRAPSENAKNQVWDSIKRIDAGYQQDLVADITVDSSLPGPASTAASAATAAASAQAQASRSYTVTSGDSLSEISRQFYGDPNEYMRIFYANRNILNDPDMIQPGQVLVIPPDDDD